MNPPRNETRFWTLDVLRGVCARVVFLSHWHLWSRFAPQGPVETTLHRLFDFLHGAFGWLTWPTGANHPAVICFFVLSGFCIHYPYALAARTGRETRDWAKFFERRFWCIMPVYWVAALLGFTLVSAEIVHPTRDPLLMFHTQATPGDLLVRLFGIGTLYPAEVFAGNQPLATLSVEIALYALYPLIHFGMLRGRSAWCGLGFLVLEFLGLALMSIVTPYWVYYTVLMLGIFWWVGAFAAEYFVAHGSRSYLREIAGCWVAFLGLKALPHFVGLPLLSQNVWGLVCVSVVMHGLHLEARHPSAATWRSIKALRYLGTISYSLYAVHTPTLLLGTWLLLQLGWRDYGVQLAVTFSLSITVVLVVYYRVERVFYRPRSRPIAAALTTGSVPA